MAYELLFNRPILAKAMKAALWNENTEAFGTPVSSRALQGFEIEPEFDTDEKKVGGVFEHLLAVLVGGNLKLANLGYDIDLLEVMTPLTSSLTGTSGSAKRRLTIPDGVNFPYIGIIIQYALDGGGDVHIGFPRSKLMKSLGVAVGESSEFAVSDIEAKFARLRLASGVLINSMQPELHATETSITDDFNTYFGL